MPGVRLGLEEREAIGLGLARGEPCAEIARRLGRPTSTVSREVHTGGGRDRYRATTAEREARHRRRRPKDRKLLRCPKLAARVSEGLTQRWSPGQIATRLRREFPDDPEARVSHETIYTSLYCQGRGGLRKELISALRSGRPIAGPERGASKPNAATCWATSCRSANGPPRRPTGPCRATGRATWSWVRSTGRPS